ncbi:MAG: hypothetical protein WD844_11480 [Thermoleophilaceae bacterium]
MLRFSDPHHFRKVVAGFCMVAAPLLLLVGMVVHPDRKTDEAAQLAVVAGNLDAWFASHMFVLAALVVAVPAVLGLMHMLREREVALGHMGGGLAMLGLMALTALVAIDGLVVWQMAIAGESPVMTALYQSFTDTAGIFIPVFVLSLAFAMGMVVLAMGLYRARAVQSWMAAFAAFGAVCLAIAGPAASDVLAVVGGAFLFVGLGSIGRMVAAESDEDWMHTPERGDFRALPGLR